VLPTYASIAGTVSYDGDASGNIRVGVYPSQEITGSPVEGTLIPETGAYTINGIPAGTYYVGAFVDVNGDSQYDALTEPFALHAGTVTVAEGDALTEIDISGFSLAGLESSTSTSGSLPVGPLAAGISAFLVWWKSRKQRQG
jgi:hypothetical protein